MRVYESAKDCPPITEDQRAEIIRRVREGRLNWVDSLMKRAKITPEECATPRARFPVDTIFYLLEKGYDVSTHCIHPKLTPADICKLHFYNFAIEHGYAKDVVIEYIRYDKEFAEKLQDIQEQVIQGEHDYEFTLEDLKALED